jgi:hypothetical protein
MSTQILKPLSGKHDKGVEWPDDEAKAEGWEDDIDENGTDYKGKKVKKSFRLYSQLIHDDDLLKAMAEEEEENPGHDDEDEDKRLIRQMMASKEKKEEIGKSFFDFISQNEILVEGVNSSPFLYEMVKSIGFSLTNLEDRVGTMMYTMDTDVDGFAKSLDGAFGTFSEQLGVINDTAGDIDVVKSSDETPESAGYLEKSGFESPNDMSRADVLNTLVKGVEAGQISPLEVIKFEHTGSISPEIQKSLGL